MCIFNVFQAIYFILIKGGNQKAIHINVLRPQPRPVRHQMLTESHSVPMLRHSELLQLIWRDFYVRDLTTPSDCCQVSTCLHLLKSLISVGGCLGFCASSLQTSETCLFKTLNRKLIKVTADRSYSMCGKKWTGLLFFYY